MKITRDTRGRMVLWSESEHDSHQISKMLAGMLTEPKAECPEGVVFKDAGVTVTLGRDLQDCGWRFR